MGPACCRRAFRTSVGRTTSRCQSGNFRRYNQLALQTRFVHTNVAREDLHPRKRVKSAVRPLYYHSLRKARETTPPRQVVKRQSVPFFLEQPAKRPTADEAPPPPPPEEPEARTEEPDPVEDQPPTAGATEPTEELTPAAEDTEPADDLAPPPPAGGSEPADDLPPTVEGTEPTEILTQPAEGTEPVDGLPPGVETVEELPPAVESVELAESPPSIILTETTTGEKPPADSYKTGEVSSMNFDTTVGAVALGDVTASYSAIFAHKNKLRVKPTKRRRLRPRLIQGDRDSQTSSGFRPVVASHFIAIEQRQEYEEVKTESSVETL